MMYSGSGQMLRVTRVAVRERMTSDEPLPSDHMTRQNVLTGCSKSVQWEREPGFSQRSLADVE